MITSTYIKAPFKVRGDKYPTLPFLFKYFPEDCNTFLDPFGGSMDVSINIALEERAKYVHCFDLNEYLMRANSDFYRFSKPSLMRKLLIDCMIYLDQHNLRNFSLLKDIYNAKDKHFEKDLDIENSL